jgi:hypothetical protein
MYRNESESSPHICDRPHGNNKGFVDRQLSHEIKQSNPGRVRESLFD